MTAPPSGQPSQRGPFLLLAILVVVLVGALGGLVVIGQRVLDSYQAEAAAERDIEGDTGPADPAKPSEKSSEQAPDPGTVRFQVVTDERSRTGSCPDDEGWMRHEQECLRLGGGFPALGTATPEFANGQPVVTIVLQPPADETMAKFTRTASGGRLAMVANERVITAPTLSGPIAGGTLQITGNFTAQETERLADLINEG